MLNCIVENQPNNDPFLLDNVDNLIKSLSKMTDWRLSSTADFNRFEY